MKVAMIATVFGLTLQRADLKGREEHTKGPKKKRVLAGDPFLSFSQSIYLSIRVRYVTPCSTVVGRGAL